MDTGSLLQRVGLHARLATAILPVIVGLGLRLFARKSRAVSWFVTFSLAWLVANVLLAPYSEGMQRDLRSLQWLIP